MPKLINRGQIADDQWLPADAATAAPADKQILTLEQWLSQPDKAGRAVQLEPGDGCEAVLPHIDTLPLIAINFTNFMDGRGFSYGRELRERGYAGELRAVGHFIRDQLHYLSRCGFDSFQFADETNLEEAMVSLEDFSEHYQAATDQPEPLFRRRA
jgi:uncharacterized protein (DUF934 family)